MDVDKLRKLQYDLELAATDAGLRADNARGTDNIKDYTEWNGRHAQYKNWATMLLEALEG
jgi:hypothetical protein